MFGLIFCILWLLASSQETGPMGPTGAMGPTGTHWARGSPGIQGLQGPQGIPGIQGDPGDVGDVGDVGQTGPLGDTGSPGEPGIMGETGPHGDPGINGSDGIVGITGATGPMGPMGPQGPAGTAGTPGETGPEGDQGIPGGPGMPGAAGTTGPEGIQGVPGVPGIAGPDGETGFVIAAPYQHTLLVLEPGDKLVQLVCNLMKINLVDCSSEEVDLDCPLGTITTSGSIRCMQSSSYIVANEFDLENDSSSVGWKGQCSAPTETPTSCTLSALCCHLGFNDTQNTTSSTPHNGKNIGVSLVPLSSCWAC